jgi:hypothetical protein
VVIDDFDLMRMAIFPFKADSPLIVDTDRVLAVALTMKRFQAITWWDSNIIEPLGIVQ